MICRPIVTERIEHRDQSFNEIIKSLELVMLVPEELLNYEIPLSYEIHIQRDKKGECYSELAVYIDIQDLLDEEAELTTESILEIIAEEKQSKTGSLPS